MSDEKKRMKKKFESRMKVRSKFTTAFFTVLFPFFFFLSSIMLFMTRNGFSPFRIFAPAFVTFWIAFLCTILGYIVSFYIMDMVFTPLEQLSEASKEVAKGNYEVCVSYDGELDEFKQTIQNFNFMVKELNSVEIMRNDFIANVSHEFKTPLASINGYVTLLQDPDLTEEERNEYIQMTFFYIEKLNDLTGNILQLSKLENQNTVSPPVTYRLDEQIREAIVLLEPKWNPKDILLDINLEECVYTGQQSLLFQVWVNLIGNAIKFSNQGDEVSIGLQKRDDAYQIIISDHGIGMTQETQAHIFEKFYQGDSSRKAQGNGLGLPLCKKILDKCGGKIQVSSEPNKGSSFTVLLYDCEQ